MDDERWLLVRCGPISAPLLATHGDYRELFARGLGLPAEELAMVSPFAGEALPAIAGWTGILVSGSYAMVTEQTPWMHRCAAWLRAVLEVHRGVLLAGCFGHQLLAWACGGEVATMPDQGEHGVVGLRLHAAGRDDPLLAGLPDEIPMLQSHHQAVITPPPGATVLASTSCDPHSILRYGPRSWGIQGHPEFTTALVRDSLTLRRDLLLGLGIDYDGAIASLRPCPAAAGLLARLRACVNGPAVRRPPG